MRFDWPTLPAALAAAVILLVFSIGACGGSSDKSESPAFRLTVVDVLPLSGALAPLGGAGRKAAELAAAEVNSTIKRTGARQSLTLVHVDDKGNPKVAVAAARREIAKPGAACLTGSWTTDVTLALANEVTVPKMVLQITPAATADVLGKFSDHGLFDRTVMPDSNQGAALAEVIEENLGGATGRKVNIAAESNSYGQGLGDTFTSAWRAKGGIVAQRVPFEPRARSYDDVAKRLVSGEPEAFAIFGFSQPYEKLGSALVRTGKWDPERTYVPDALASRELPNTAGKEATDGLRGTAPGAPDESPATKAFGSLFARTPGAKRMAFDAQLFDAVVVCYLAAMKAGKADGAAMAATVPELTAPPGDKFTWQQLPEAVAAIERGDDVDYEGASGPIDMNSRGDATAGAYDLFRFRDGVLEVYDQVSLPVSGG